jgi:hypothetical protein
MVGQCGERAVIIFEGKLRHAKTLDGNYEDETETSPIVRATTGFWIVNKK